MNLFQIATRGIDLDTAPITPDDESPREGFRFEEPAVAPSRLRVPAELDEVFSLAAKEYGVDVDVLRGIAYAESRFNPDIISGKVKSKAGAIGLMQFMPDTAKEYGIDPADPAQAIIGGAAYLRKSLDKFDGDYERAVASYNWGPNRKAYDSEDWASKAPQETQKYMMTVFGAVGKFKDGAAERGLPQGVTPSKAGAGRGVVNPGMVNTQETQAIAPPVQQPSQPTSTDRTAMEWASDTSKSVAQGLLDVASLPGAAYSAVTGDWDTGYMNAIRGTQEVLQEQKSPGMQAQQKALQDKLKTAEGWREKLAVGGVETITNPALLVDTLARSGPGMLAGGLAGRVAGAGANALGNAAIGRTIATGSEAAARVALVAKNGAGAIARGVATGTAASQQGVSVANEVYGELSKLPPEAFSSEPEFAELSKQFGPEQAKDVLASAAANRALLMATGASVLSMKMVPGGSAIETMFLPSSLKGAAAKAVASTSLLTKPIGKGMSGGVVAKTVEMMVQGAKTGSMESVSEGFEEASGAGASGLELSRAGQDVNLGEMMGEAGGQGAAAGFAMGKVAGMQEAYQAPRVESQPTTPQAPPVAPAAPVQNGTPPVAPTTPAAQGTADAIMELERRLQAAANPTAQPTADAGTTPVAPTGDAGATEGAGGTVAAVADGRPEQAQSLSIPENFTATPTATVGTQTNVQAGPGFTGKGLAAEMAALRARSQPTNSLSRTSSWVIKEKATGNVILETFDKTKVDALNTAKYEAVPIQQHLASLSQSAPVTTQPATQQAEQPRTTKAVQPAKANLDPQGLLSDDERQMLGEFTRLYQTDLKADIRQRLGLTPKEQATAQVEKKPSALLSLIVQMGGIKSGLSSDLTGANAMEGNRRYPGLFRNNGKQLDVLVQSLKERGYLTQADEDSILDNGGTNKLADMIQAELSGERAKLVDNTDGFDAMRDADMRQGMEDKATALGLSQDMVNSMSDDRLNGTIKRIEARLGHPIKTDFATRKMSRAEARAEREAILMADRYERARAKYDAELQAFAEADDTIQDAALDVLTDEDGEIVIVRERDADAELAAQTLNGTWSDQNEQATATTRDTGPSQDQGEAGPPVTRGQNQGAEADQGNGTQAGEGSQEALTTYTPEEVTAQQEAADKAERTAKAKKQADDLSAKKEQERKEIAKASVAAADTFELGGNAEDNLTGQEGLKFSRKAKVETNERNLIIQHNLSSDNLLHAVKMGGIAVPSLAVTTKTEPLTGFGEITLIGSVNMADPKGYAGTKVFGADIYSPRYPSVTFEFTPNMRKRGESMLKDGMAATDSRYLDWSEVERDGARELKRQPAVMWQFLRSKGIEPVITRTQPKPLADRIMPFKDDTRHSHELAADPAFVEAVYQTHLDMLIEAYGGDAEAIADATKEVEKLKATAEERGRSQLVNGYAQGVNQYQRDARQSGQVDREATRRALENQVREADLTVGLRDYAASIVTDLNPNERIFQGFTNSGKRKYIPHTLENVVKLLKKELRGGESFNYGVGSLRAKFTPQFKTVADIRNNKDRLISSSDFDKVKDEINAEFLDMAEAMGIQSETLSAIMEDAAKMGVARAAATYDVDVGGNRAVEIAEFMTRLRNLPTAYFEAKILRDVDLAEFSAAVIPSDASQKVRSALESRGVTNVFTYERNNEADRKRAIQEAAESKDDLAFSKATDRKAAQSALARIMENGVTSPDDLRALLRVPGYSQWAKSALAGDMAASTALRSELADAFGQDDWRAPKLNQQGIVTLYPDWGQLNGKNLEKLTELADKYDAPIALRGGPVDPGSATEVKLSSFGFERYNGMQERADRLPGVLFGMIRPAGGITATTPLFSQTPAAPPKATTSIIRQAITKAYGNLLTRLEGKGLVSLTQTEEEAIAAAAQARADQNGGDVEQIKQAMRASVLASQRAWHGTPHRGIEKFSTDKIGTGEGAQAFGYGLYFADMRELAEVYRRKLTSDDGTPARQSGGDSLQVKIGRLEQEIRTLEKDDSPSAKSMIAAYRKRIAELDKQGQLYEVDIPNDTDMLLWDKPLSEQPASVLKALTDNYADSWLGDLKGQTGKDLYQRIDLSHGGDMQAASKELAELGIKGIKYLDGQSRNKPLRDVKREFLAELPEDADFAEVMDLLGTGTFSDKNEAVIKALADLDWLGFDYPAQAISTALGNQLQNFDPSPELVQAVAATRDDSTYNYVVFSGDDVQIVDVKYSKDGALEGFFDPATGKSFLIADNLTAESAPGTLMHEVGIHMAADGKLEPLFNRAARLLKLGKSNPFLQRVQARMDQSGETSAEEAAAYIVTEYENDRANAPASVAQWVKDFIADVRAWLFNKGVLLKADQLTVADIAAVARANAKSMAVGDSQGEVRNSKQATPDKRESQIESENFKRWFAGSKVVDANGKPLVVYHGTGSDFSSFDRTRIGQNFTESTLGFYFTNAAKPDFENGFGFGSTASEYANNTEGRPTVMPVYLSIKNPLVLDDAGEWGGAALAVDKRRSDIERWAKDGNHDGVLVFDKTGEDSERIFIAFKSTQIKSAIGNNGNFDPANPDIRRSISNRAQQPLFNQTPAHTWEELGDSKVDSLIYEGQDDRIDLKRVQENIAKAGRQVREEFDARMAETLFPGRVAKRNESFVDHEVKPLLQAMSASNVSMEELGDYLLARHAPERNAQIAKVNPGMPDGGAGTNSQGVLMTTQAAQDHIANLSAGKRTALQLLARQVDAITKGTRKMLVTEGLEKASTVAAWEGACQNYVPLFKDEAAETPGHPVGSGFSVKGGASKRAMGSTKEVTNVLAHVLMQREAAITRAEKNRVAMSLYGLALSNPNKEFWGTVVPNMSTPKILAELQNMGVNVADAFAGMEATPTIRYVDPNTGLVTERPNPVYKNLDNALVVKVNGEDRVILFNKQNARAMRLAESLKNQNRGSGVFVEGTNLVAPVTRFMASMLTQYNPAFGMVNAVRDIQGALVNLSSTDLKGQQAKVLAGVHAAMKGIARDLRGDKARTQWSDLWLQFQDDGGRTGIRDLVSDPYEKAGQIEKDLKRLESAGKLTPGNAAHAVLDLLSDFNDTLENGVRLSAYKTALDQGMSRPAAAKLARELTVDFNRKGRTGRELGKLYAFLNASIQGSARTIQSLKGPMGAKIMAGGFAIGVLQAFMLAAAGFDDEDIPEFIKSRNLIIPMGGDRYVTIPMALGLHVLPNTGRAVTELVMSGGKDIGTKSLNTLVEIVTSFNPFGGGGDWQSAHGPLTMVTPTVMDPVIDMAMNRDFTGRQISKERRNPGDVRPGATLARESTKKSPSGQVYIGLSELINKATLGTDVTKGAWSPTPEELRYMATVLGGGVYRETERAVNAAVLLARGEEVKSHQVPLGSRFAGTLDEEMSTMGRYYKNDEALNKFWSEFKAEAKDGNTERVAEMKRDPRFAAAAMNSKIEQHISKLNKLAGENVGDKAKYEALNQRRAELMRKVNEAVKEAESK